MAKAFTECEVSISIIHPIHSSQQKEKKTVLFDWLLTINQFPPLNMFQTFSTFPEAHQFSYIFAAHFVFLQQIHTAATMGSLNIHQRLLFIAAFSLLILSHDKFNIFQNVAAHTQGSQSSDKPSIPTKVSSTSFSVSSSSKQSQGADDAQEVDSLFKEMLEPSPQGADYDANELDALFKQMLDSLPPSESPQGADYDAHELDSMFKAMLDSLPPSPSPGADYDAHDLDSMFKEWLDSPSPSPSPQGSDYDARELDSMFKEWLGSPIPSPSPQGADYDAHELDSMFKEMLDSPAPSPSDSETPASDGDIPLATAAADDFRLTTSAVADGIGLAASAVADVADNTPAPSLGAINFDAFKFTLAPALADSCDPTVKSICNSTDNPALCLATVVPFLSGKADAWEVFETSVKVTNEYANYVLFMLKKLATSPGGPGDVVAVLNDCHESYDDVMYNFETAMSALPTRDIGTINVRLSAVFTDVGDCDDLFKGISFPSPLTEYSDQLIDLTSNCLALTAVVHN